MEFLFEQKILLALLSHELSGTPLPDMDAGIIDFQKLLRESVSQTVFLLVYDACRSGINLPEPVKVEWEKQKNIQTLANVRTTYAQTFLNTILTQAGLRYVTLKGFSACRYYPAPALRTLGDVDFLVPSDELDRTQELLAAQGFSKSLDDHPSHIVYQKPGYHYELHFRVNGIPDLPIGKVIEEYFRTSIDRAVSVTVSGERFSALSDVDHALVMLIHTQSHLSSNGFGLRHLCDWAAFMNAARDSETWNEITRLAGEWGLKTYCDVLCRTCEMYLGCRLPYPTGTTVDDELCRDLMANILDGGNFGKKDVVRSGSGLLLGQNVHTKRYKTKVGSLYHTLHSSTPNVYPIVRRITILHPVMDVVRIIRYIGKILCGKRPGFGDALADAKSRTDFLSRLELFEIKK